MKYKKSFDSIQIVQSFTIIYFISQQMGEQVKSSILVHRLLQNIPKHKISTDLTHVTELKIQNDLIIGAISISQLSDDCDQYINHFTKDTALKHIYKSNDSDTIRQDFKIMSGNELQGPVYVPPSKPKQPKKKIKKVEEVVEVKKTQEEIRRQFLQKLKNWEMDKVRRKERKRDLEDRKKSLENSFQQKKKRQQDQINMFQKLQRKKSIENKLKQIQQRKLKREELLHDSAIRKSQSVPKFQHYQNKYKEAEKQKELENKILLKNRKVSLEMDLNQIKQHEKAYIQRIKQRLNIKSQNDKKINKSQESISKNKADNISIHKKNEEEIIKLKERMQKLKKFQNKVRLIPLKIDQQKKKQIQIKGDKLKNQKKYIFLSQKALSDEQIYQEFKDFDINIDSREVGQKYLQQMKENNKKSKRKVSSQKVLPSSKPQYKNYLADLKQKRSNIIVNPDEFDNLTSKLSKQKDKGVQYLLKKSEQYENKMFDNIKELKKINNYHDSIKKEEQIDGNYMKAIKSKLALAKIN